MNVNGATINDIDARNLILGKTTGVKKMKSKDGKSYSARLQLQTVNGEAQIKFVFVKK